MILWMVDSIIYTMILLYIILADNPVVDVRGGRMQKIITLWGEYFKT